MPLQLHTAPPGRVLKRTQNHLYLLPHPALRRFVAHYTITFPAKQAPDTSAITLMPDISGCFVFMLENQREALFWGASTKAVTLEADFNDVPMRFFVEFAPGGAHALTGLAMHELTDSIVTGQDTLPELFKRMTYVLEQTTDLEQVLQQVDDLLLAQLARQNSSANANAAPLLALLKNGKHSSVRSVADAAGYSERHLSRLFAQALGAGVKTCSQVVRINYVLKNLHSNAGLAQLAQAAGYYDQPHFNHDFKAVCGVSPTAYLKSMSGFYKEDYKF